MPGRSGPSPPSRTAPRQSQTSPLAAQPPIRVPQPSPPRAHPGPPPAVPRLCLRSSWPRRGSRLSATSPHRPACRWSDRTRRSGCAPAKRHDAALMQPPEFLGQLLPLCASFGHGGVRREARADGGRQPAHRSEQPTARRARPVRLGCGGLRVRRVRRGVVIVLPRQYSCRHRHNRTPCRPVATPCRTGPHCPAGIAPEWCRPTAHRAACRSRDPTPPPCRARIARQHVTIGQHDQRQRPLQQAALGDLPSRAGAGRARGRVRNGDDTIGQRIGDKHVPSCPRARPVGPIRNTSRSARWPNPSATTVRLLITGALPSAVASSIRSTVALATIGGRPVAGSRTCGPCTSNPAMLTNSVALVPSSATAMLPQGPLMSGPAQVSTGWPFASITSRQPAPFVPVVPSLLSVLPTITQPLLSMIIAVVRPTPPGHCGRCPGSLANSVVCLTDGL